ncbi:type 1 glutamine amidotransferase domain-containing protein [Chitinophagaceae bacterium LB-8]|uniref:Type 1 glutamine amidotransferase domain-containing protein n=1 Tax=Paraflavisolibacter caeni TaxID=2982496 RepID=A0A9X2Y1A8_9BACT|nr:type 1 glutamine amidotransferase domain-containing protein [Paraflavisolibacter caeni]MCU7552925.1 type 1 glutamine amidotransferase domain-containing protein [Paraflavisolibacter caeni]
MSHKNLNTANAKKVAIVISNPGTSTTGGWPVGFWWSELTHPYFKLTEKGHEAEIFSYFGGKCEADALSNPEDPSQWQPEDVISRGYIHDPAFMKKVDDTKPAKDIDVTEFDALVVVGGQGPMFLLEKAADTIQKFVEFYEAGKFVVALCHGVAILKYARLSSGEYLAKGKTVTGFANIEEDYSDESVWSMNLLPKDKHVMPWRIEDELKAIGANYIQAGLWRGFAIRDGFLITGQQNFSGSETADVLIQALGE